MLELVPGLWDDSEGDWHFRGGILSMLSRLVAALQEGSNRALGIVVPLIKSALDPSQVRISNLFSSLLTIAG